MRMRFVAGANLGKKLMPVRLSLGFQIVSRLLIANSGMKGHVMVHRMIFGVLVLMVGVRSTSAEDKTTERRLPKVLLIGDSIMGGYYKPTSARLKDEAVVTRIDGQGGHTGTGLEKLDSWLGDTKWDVIHFNWGLHDIAYHPPGMKRVEDKVKGKVTTSLEDYERNLDKLVIRLKKTGAKLIWASTTVVPEGDPGRFVGDDKKYNDVAEKIMKKHGVVIDDLYTLSKTFPPKLLGGPGNVHFAGAGYGKLGDQVADAIRAAFKDR